MEDELLDKFMVDDLNQALSGCYISDPILSKSSTRRLIVPLKHIDYQIEIVNSLTHITIQQTYFNPIDKYLAVDFSMPIDPNSCIYKIEATFNDIKLQGIIKQKQQAKKQFQSAKREGRQTLLASLQEKSRDIFNFDIGNIPPNTQFVVRIQLIQELILSMNTFYKLFIPSTISPRYINKIQQTKIIPEYEKNKGRSSGKPDYKWSFKIDVQTTRKIVFFECPSHKLDCISKNGTQTQLTLVMQNSELLNKDFIFYYTTQNFHLPSCVLGTTDISSTILSSFIPKFCQLKLTDAYKAEKQNKSLQVKYQSVKGDFVFLLDRSGSMGGSRINKAKQALILFIKSLPQDSYFNVISFGSDSKKMFRKSQKYSHDQIQSAIQEIDQMTADMGGTQIYRPLKQVLTQKNKSGYPRHTFVLTDGQVSNTQGVIQLVKHNTKYGRVHTIGIGNGASLNLIKGCAQKGKGKYIMISDQQNPGQKIIQLLQSVLSPVITKMQLLYDQKYVQSIVPNPKSIPYILKDQIVNFYITYKKPLDQNQNQTFTFKYQDSLTKLPYQITQTMSSNYKSMPFIDKMSHFKILRELQNLAENKVQFGDNMYYVKVKDYKKQAINYSIKHQILSKFTAFLCIGKKLIDGQYQEYQNKGNDHIHVQQFGAKIHSDQILHDATMNRRVQLLKLQDYNQYYSMIPPSPMLSQGSIQFSQSRGGSRGSRGRGGSGSMGMGSGHVGLYDKGGQWKSSNKSSDSDSDEDEDLQQDMSYSSGSNLMEECCDLQYSPKKHKKSLPRGRPQQKSRSREKARRKDRDSGQRQRQSNKKRKKAFGQSSPIKKQRYKINTQQKQKSSKMTVKQVVKSQNTNGSWSQCSLINQLAKNSQEVFQLIKIFNASIVVTKLVIQWFMKYHDQKQYALILKKAKQWLKKALTTGGFSQQKLSKIEV